MKLCKDCKHYIASSTPRGKHSCVALVGGVDRIHGRKMVEVEVINVDVMTMRASTICGWDNPKLFVPKDSGA